MFKLIVKYLARLSQQFFNRLRQLQQLDHNSIASWARRPIIRLSTSSVISLPRRRNKFPSADVKNIFRVEHQTVEIEHDSFDRSVIRARFGGHGWDEGLRDRDDGFYRELTASRVGIKETIRHFVFFDLIRFSSPLTRFSKR